MSSKNDLQELMQKQKQPLPVYITEEDRKLILFRSKITIFDVEYVGEWKRSKKDAEKSVADKVLENIKKVEKKENVLNLFEIWCKEGYYFVLKFSGLKDTQIVKYYLTCAFLHASYREKMLRSGQESILNQWLGIGQKDIPSYIINNSGLSTLGDSVIKCQQTFYFFKEKFKKFEQPTSEFLTKSRRDVETREFMRNRMIQMNLDQYVMYYGEMPLKETFILGEVLESYIGAIYLMEGEEKAKEVLNIMKLFNKDDYEKEMILKKD